MAKTSQHRAVANNRKRLKERGMSRYEVRGLESDKALVRLFAKRLSERDATAQHLREAIEKGIAEKPESRGQIYAALRRSPLVGVGLNLERMQVPPREIDL